MKYSRALDLILASLQYASKSDTVNAAKAYKMALAATDLEVTVASLDRIQATLKKREETASVSILDAVTAKKHKKVSAKPKRRPMVRASDDEDFDEVMDDMTVEDASDDGLSLDDIEEDLDDMPEAKATAADESDEDSEEDESEEEDAADDSDEDEEEEEEEDASEMDSTDDLEVNIEGDGEGVSSKKKKVKASPDRIKRVMSNLDAVRRMATARKSK